MNAAIALKDLGLKTAVLIDDAFAAPGVNDIDGAAMAQLDQALRDDPKRIEQLELEFRIALNPEYPERTRDFVSDASRLQLLWNKRLESGWDWLGHSIFKLYEAELDPKRQALRPILDYLSSTGLAIAQFGSFDSAESAIVHSDIVFLDFFLKDERHPDESLLRADQLSRLLEEVRSNENRRYPLIVLFSSRSGAEALASDFKERSSLRGCFFHFLAKSRTGSDELAICLARLLPDYVRNQRLARLLDGYGDAAVRAAAAVRKLAMRLEPTDIALLHAAALIAENEKLNQYLEWLTSVFLSTAFSADAQMKALSQEIGEIGSKMPLPGHIPADRTLGQLFIRTTARVDLADSLASSMEYKLALGDIFVEGEPDAVLRDPGRLLVVIDQSCELTRADSPKERVLCLRASNCVEIDDMALAVYDSENWPTYFLELTVLARTTVLRVTWNLIDAETISRRLLDDRRGFNRIARLQEVIALQLQERFLQSVGRIGTAAQPPLVGAYSARLRLGKGKLTLDTRSEPWAAVTVVSGRKAKQKKDQQQFGAEHKAQPAGQPKPLRSKPGSDSEPMLDLFLCGEFVTWLLRTLPTSFGDDVGLRGAVTSLRNLLNQDGGHRGTLGLPKDNGARKLTLGNKPAQIILDVVETEEHFDASGENLVLQLIEHAIKVRQSGHAQ